MQNTKYSNKARAVLQEDSSFNNSTNTKSYADFFWYICIYVQAHIYILKRSVRPGGGGVKSWAVDMIKQNTVSVKKGYLLAAVSIGWVPISI